jgi:hypothetical protein
MAEQLKGEPTKNSGIALRRIGLQFDARLTSQETVIFGATQNSQPCQKCPRLDNADIWNSRVLIRNFIASRRPKAT